MPFLWEGKRSNGASFYSLPKDLEFVDCLVFCSWRWLGLSFFGERSDPWLDSSPLKEKGNKPVADDSTVLDVGNLEGEEQSSF